ncbi:transposase [Streptomyces sp. NPDC041003]|uniref:transposase n=1 Tax=Streptomyces sp. NPDC041003 TaxID=3155730 RepID=UPI0033FAC521
MLPRCARKGGPLTGPNPVNRGKAGSKLPVLTDAQGLPVAVGASAANVNDVQALRPLVLGIPAVRSRRGPRRRHPDKVRADKAYHSAGNLAWLRERSIIPRIARPGQVFGGEVRLGLAEFDGSAPPGSRRDRTAGMPRMSGLRARLSRTAPTTGSMPHGHHVT